MTDYPDFLFVYGTLMASAGHHLGELLRKNGSLISKGHIRARLYLIEEFDAQGHNIFPGAVFSADPNDVTHGEVWEIHDKDRVFPAFDAYENCGPDWPQPNEFLLRPVDVTLADDTILRAASYLYTWDVSHARHIASGRLAAPMPLTR